MSKAPAPEIHINARVLVRHIPAGELQQLKLARAIARDIATLARAPRSPKFLELLREKLAAAAEHGDPAGTLELAVIPEQLR